MTKAAFLCFQMLSVLVAEMQSSMQTLQTVVRMCTVLVGWLTAHSVTVIFTSTLPRNSVTLTRENVEVCVGKLPDSVVIMPSGQSPKGIMFLGCPSKFRLSFRLSIRLLCCGFRSLYLSVLQISYWNFAYTLPIFVLRHLLIFRSPVQRSEQ